MKTVFITGMSRGLGKELFNLFASGGYKVYGVLRNPNEAARLKNEIPENTKLIVADLATDESIDLIKEAVGNQAIDLLINNAGVGGEVNQIENVTSAEVLSLFNIHCLSVIRTSKALTQHLLKAEKPLVLNLNSRFGSITRQSNGTYKELAISYSYRIAKASQNMLTNCLRLEFKDRIDFISLHPGRMKTALASKDADLEPKEVAQRILEFYEGNQLKEENGIVELGKEVIEW